MIQSSYLKDALDIKTLPKVVTQLANAILEKQLDFNAIAFRGMSGALVTPMLCRRLNKGMIVCRKESEQSHGDACEGFLIGGNYIIVDDFISGGSTVRGIDETIEKWRTKWIDIPQTSPFNLIAVFLYQRTNKTARRVIFKGKDIPVYGVHQIYKI